MDIVGVNMSIDQLSNSKIKCFMRCPRKYEYEYIRNLSPRAVATPLEFGRIFHSAMEDILLKRDWRESVNRQFDRWGRAQGDSIDQVKFDKLYGTIIGMLTNYETEVVPHDDFEVVSTEEVITAKINAPFGLPVFVGTVDAIVKRNGQLYVMEHKSAADLRVDHLMLDPQVTRYAWALREMGMDIKGTIYNIVRKVAPTARSKPPYTYREIIFRGDDVLDECGLELYEIAQNMSATKSYPRNPTRDCTWDCAYRHLCEAELGGGDASSLIENNYQTREERYSL